MTCVTISAIDDDVVEFNETAQIIPYLLNPNDVANGTILLTIIDNDGNYRNNMCALIYVNSDSDSIAVIIHSNYVHNKQTVM